MKKISLVVFAALIAIAGCAEPKTIYHYTIPGEGMPVIEVVDNCTIESYSDITNLSKSKKIEVKAGTAISFDDSCVIIQEKGKAELKNDIADTAWLYRIKNGILEGHKEIEFSFKKGMDVELLTFLAEGYFIVKRGRKIIDMHVSELEIKQKPVTRWFVKDSALGVWVEVDTKCIDVIKRNM